MAGRRLASRVVAGMLDVMACIHGRLLVALMVGLSLVVATLSLVVYPGLGSAATGRSGTVRLSPRGRSVAYPVVAVDGTGDAYALWMQGFSSSYIIAGSTWSAKAKRWSAESTVSLPGAAFPRVAANQRGSAVAVWETNQGASGSGGATALGVAYRQGLAGGWERSRILVRGSEGAATPVAGIDARGDATAAWQSLQRGVSSRIEVATRSVQSGTWSAPHELMASPKGVFLPSLAVSPTGAAVMVWMRYLSGTVSSASRNTVWASLRPSGRGAWSKPVRLGTEFEPPGQSSGTSQVPGPQVAINSAGEAVVVWQGHQGNTVVPVAAIFKGRSWSHTVVSHNEGLLPRVGIDSGGVATVVWAGPRGVEAATRPAGTTGSFRVKLVARGSDTSSAQVAVSGRGDVFAVWNSGRFVFASSRRASLGGWCRPLSLGVGGLVQIGATENMATIVWQVAAEHPPGTYAAAHQMPECRSQHG